MLQENIYYADQINLVSEEFNLVHSGTWSSLYKCTVDKSYWRLDHQDKYQEQYVVRIADVDTWEDFDSRSLQIQLLKKTRGTTAASCIWQDCSNYALKNLVFCELHAYQMGITR